MAEQVLGIHKHIYDDDNDNDDDDDDDDDDDYDDDDYVLGPSGRICIFTLTFLIITCSSASIIRAKQARGNAS